MFFVEKEKPKIKKKMKNLSRAPFFLGFTFSSRGQREKKKKQFLLAPKLRFFPPVRPSVVEEELEDLEDVHHRGDV